MKKSFSIPKSGPGGRGGAGQGADGRAPPPQLQGGSRRAARSPGTAGTAGRGPAEPKRGSPLRLRHARPGERLCRRSVRLPAATAAARAAPPALCTPRDLRKCFNAPAPRSRRVPCLCSPVSVAPLQPRKPLPPGVGGGCPSVWAVGVIRRAHSCTLGLGASAAAVLTAAATGLARNTDVILAPVFAALQPRHDCVTLRRQWGYFQRYSERKNENLGLKRSHGHKAFIHTA